MFFQMLSIFYRQRCESYIIHSMPHLLSSNIAAETGAIAVIIGAWKHFFRTEQGAIMKYRIFDVHAWNSCLMEVFSNIRWTEGFIERKVS